MHFFMCLLPIKKRHYFGWKKQFLRFDKKKISSSMFHIPILIFQFSKSFLFLEFLASFFSSSYIPLLSSPLIFRFSLASIFFFFLVKYGRKNIQGVSGSFLFPLLFLILVLIDGILFEQNNN